MLKVQSAQFPAALLVLSLFFSILSLPRVAVGQNRFPPCSIGSTEFAWNNCRGSRTDPNGNKYIGEFKNGLPNGQGTLTLADGGIYVGEFKDNKYNGQGTFTQPNGNKYVGEFRDGKGNGRGTYTHPDGSTYVGEFRDNTANGRGTFTFPDGSKYVGEVKGFTFSGQGIFTYPDGTKYVGEFNGNNRNGEGTYFAADGSAISSGVWIDDKFMGALADQDSIKMEHIGGVYVVPVRFNDSITLDAVVDSGAADVSIPADVVLTLMRAKTIAQGDFLGQQTYILADGSKVPSQRLRIRSLKVGNKIVQDVVASIASVNGEILLGQSFLSKFKSWAVDNEQHVLILK